MSSVPPTNSVKTSEPTVTTISARVIEGLSVLDRLPARGSFLAQIIEIKEPNLIKLSVGIKELKARINGNVPPNIKPNMTIKFHTTAQKNNIKLFLPEPHLSKSSLLLKDVNEWEPLLLSLEMVSMILLH